MAGINYAYIPPDVKESLNYGNGNPIRCTENNTETRRS